jgi:hypothetical protein
MQTDHDREQSIRLSHGYKKDCDCSICFLLRRLDAARALKAEEIAEAATAFNPYRECKL